MRSSIYCVGHRVLGYMYFNAKTDVDDVKIVNDDDDYDDSVDDDHDDDDDNEYVVALQYSCALHCKSTATRRHLGQHIEIVEHPVIVIAPLNKKKSLYSVAFLLPDVRAFQY